MYVLRFELIECYAMFQRVVQREKDRGETAKAANEKLMHECDVLQNRLQECNVKFQIEDESKLIMESSSPSEAIDLLATSDNRIGLLIAEVGSTKYTLMMSLCMF